MYLGTKYGQQRVHIPKLRVVETSKHVSSDESVYSLLRKMNVNYENGEKRLHKDKPDSLHDRLSVKEGSQAANANSRESAGNVILAESRTNIQATNDSPELENQADASLPITESRHSR